MRTVKSSFGHVYVGLRQRGAKILEAQSVRSQRRGIGLDAHRGTLSAADADESYPGKLRNFLGQRRVRKIFDFGQRQRFGSNGQRQDRRIGGVNLAIELRGVEGPRGESVKA